MQHEMMMKHSLKRLEGFKNKEVIEVCPTQSTKE